MLRFGAKCTICGLKIGHYGGPLCEGSNERFLDVHNTTQKSNTALQRCQHLIVPPGIPFDVYVRSQGTMRIRYNLFRSVALRQQPQ